MYGSYCEIIPSEILKWHTNSLSLPITESCYCGAKLLPVGLFAIKLVLFVTAFLYVNWHGAT